MNVALPSNPVPLDFVKVTTPGTLVCLTANHTTYGVNTPKTTDDLYVTIIELKAASANSGALYLGYAGMVRSTGVGVLRTLDPGESYSLCIPGGGGDMIRVADFEIDADNANDGAYVSGWVR